MATGEAVRGRHEIFGRNAILVNPLRVIARPLDLSKILCHMRGVMGLFAVAALGLGAGCFPYHFTLRPGAEGHVRDTATGTPIQGAVVMVSPSNNKGPRGQSTTDCQGEFQVPARRLWWFYLVPQDVFPLPFTLSVRHEGYQTLNIEFLHRAMEGGSKTNFGEIRMQKTAP